MRCILWPAEKLAFFITALVSFCIRRMNKSDSNPQTRGKRSAGKLGWAALLIAAGLTLGLSLYYGVIAKLAGDALTMPFGTGAAVVLSGSMSPTLEVNDLVLVQEKEHYEVGDIVVYQSGNSLVVHRVAALEGTQIITRGDANNVSDAPVDISAVKGTVVIRIPHLGAVINILKLPAVEILLLAGACILLGSSFKKENRAAEEENLDEMKEEIRRLKAELSSTREEKPNEKEK